MLAKLPAFRDESGRAGGYGCADPTRVLRQGQVDQGNCPPPEGVAEDGAQGAAFGGRRVKYEREVQPLPKLSRWKDHLYRLLAANEAKPGRERLTLIRLFGELRALGYAGGYDAVRRDANACARIMPLRRWMPMSR